MTIATATHTITRAHTATHLSNAIVGAVAEILTHLGISARSLMDEWDVSYDPAIRKWIEEESLSRIVLECHRPSGRVEPILEFPIEYFSDGSASLSHRHVALARQWVKFNRVPKGTSWKIICQYRGAHTQIDGWGSTTRASKAGLREVTLGTLAAGPHSAASIRAYTS